MRRASDVVCAPKRPKISVIVAFYDIAECVRLCVDSLLAQTYVDHEIILVDDGSHDATGALLDSYEDDQRVRVLHKENGGLSSARNHGVVHARGEYVTFVDGDDIVSPYYLEALVTPIERDGVDLVMGGIERLANDDVDGYRFAVPRGAAKVPKEELLSRIMYEEILPSGCSHLAPRSVYRDHPFPEGVYYEEIASIATYLNAAENCAVIEDSIYGYVMREGSIVHRKRAAYQQVLDYERALERFSSLSRLTFPEESPEAMYFGCLHASRLYRLLGVVVAQDEQEEELLRQKKGAIVERIRAALPQLKRDGRISTGNKLRFILLARFPNLYAPCFDLYDRARG